MKRLIPCLVIIGVFASASFAGFDHTISSEYKYTTLTLNNESLLVTGAGALSIDAYFSSYVEVRGTAPLEQLVGGIYTLDLSQTSSLYQYGGEIGLLTLRKSATAVISGGQISYINSFQNVPTDDAGVTYPHITFICDMDSVDLTGDLLTGNWLDGSSFSVTLSDQTGYDSVYSNINFIPEPATLLLLGIGGLLLRKRKS